MTIKPEPRTVEPQFNEAEFEAVNRAIAESLEIAVDCGEDYSYIGKLHSAQGELNWAERRAKEAEEHDRPDGK